MASCARIDAAMQVNAHNPFDTLLCSDLIHLDASLRVCSATRTGGLPRETIVGEDAALSPGKTALGWRKAVQESAPASTPRAGLEPAT